MPLLIALWLLFFFSHSFLASIQVKAAAEKMLGGGFKFYRLLYNLLSLAFLGGIGYLLLFRQAEDYVIHPSPVLHGLGIALLVIGILLVVLAFMNYDLGEFTGIKQLAQKIHHPEKLVITGINRWVRNPLYFGLIVFFMGFFLVDPTQMRLVSVVIIYAYIYIGATLEERKLAQAFGEEYRTYQKKVKMLIPFIF